MKTTTCWWKIWNIWSRDNVITCLFLFSDQTCSHLKHNEIKDDSPSLIFFLLWKKRKFLPTVDTCRKESIKSHLTEQLGRSLGAGCSWCVELLSNWPKLTFCSSHSWLRRSSSQSSAITVELWGGSKWGLEQTSETVLMCQTELIKSLSFTFLIWNPLHNFSAAPRSDNEEKAKRN